MMDWRFAHAYQVRSIAPWTHSESWGEWVTVYVWPRWYLTWCWLRRWALARITVVANDR